MCYVVELMCVLCSRAEVCVVCVYDVDFSRCRLCLCVCVSYVTVYSEGSVVHGANRACRACEVPMTGQ